MYMDCACVADGIMYKMNNSMEDKFEDTTGSTMASTAIPQQMNATNMTGPPMGAYQGICMSDCIMMYVVAPLLFIGMFLTFSTVSPTQTATLR